MISSRFIRNLCLIVMLGVLFTLQLSAQQPAQPQTQQGKTEPPAEGQTLHVLVGKSVVVNVSSPLTRVLSSNPNAIETMATSPTEVVVEGKAPGASSVILWDAAGHSQVLDVEVDL